MTTALNPVSIETVLACPNLPTLPTVAVQLLDLIRDPDVGIADIRRLVESDTGLAGRVLKTVNSSAFGLRQKCNNIQRALGFLGMSSIKSVVLGFSLVDWTKNVEGDGFDLEDYWRRLIYSAAGARHIALAVNACDPDDAFTGALFQNMGMLAMLTRLGSEYLAVADAASSSHDALPDAEQEHLGFDHTETGAALGEKWRLPAPTIQCIRYHHAPDKAPAEYRQLTRVVALSRLAAAALCESDAVAVINRFAEHAKKWFDIDRETSIALIEAASSGGHELSKIFDKNLGARPDINALLAEAGDQLLEHQLTVARQVNDLEHEKEELKKSSLTDALTGAWNRKMFDQMIAEAFENARAAGGSVAVIFMDGDKFKSVNDTYGHKAGDAVIRLLADRMTCTLGDIGAVCRFGGEEFVAILENVDADAAMAAAESTRAAIADAPFQLAGVEGAPDELPVTASLGVSVWTAGGRECNADMLVHEADEAVYQSKHDGRNRVTLHPNARPAPCDTAGALAASATNPLAAAGAVDDNSATRVLLVEGDPLAAKLLDAIFSQSAGIEITLTGDLRSANLHLESVGSGSARPPHLIVISIDLPDGAGIELVRSVRAVSSLAGVPLIVMAGPSDAAAIRACRAAGATAVYARSDISRHVTRWTRDVLAMTGSRVAA